jgi:tetratricopeptide (TPR) repeat protein
MAEGIIGGALGEEEERPEVEAPEGPSGAEAFAASIAAIASRQDPQVARDTSAFLQEQTKLLKLQSEYIEIEHTLRMAHLRNQVKEENVRRLGLRLRVSFQFLMAFVSAAIALGLLVMINDSVTSRGVVIDLFDVPPAPATTGLNGKVVAAGLLDVLTKIQAASRSAVERRALSNAWTSEISIEIPETGLSIGQLERMLKTRFGHDQHIDGDLVATEKGGFALTVRGSGILPKTFADEGRNLEKLLTQAGEYVYGQSQPGLWTAYLSNNNRADEAIAFAKASYQSVSPTERPYVLNYWANAINTRGGAGANQDALPLYREAVRLKPDYWTGYNNIMVALNALGDEEGVVRTGKELMKLAGGRPGRAGEEMYQNYDVAVLDLPAVLASNISDLENHGGNGTTSSAGGSENLSVALLEALMHDVQAATLGLKTTLVDEKNVSDVAIATFAQALLAEEAGDFKAAASQWDAFFKAYADPSFATSNPPLICYAAVAYEKTGQPTSADAALRPFGGATFVDCYRFKADVLDMRGDWEGAKEWYAKGVKLGPSIPSGYYSWGRALFKHGDLDGAAAKFKEANKKGPHWADPLKAWGDVLAKQGKSKEALAKYDEALKYAPNWKQLKDVREAIAQQKS